MRRRKSEVSFPYHGLVLRALSAKVGIQPSPIDSLELQNSLKRKDLGENKKVNHLYVLVEL